MAQLTGGDDQARAPHASAVSTFATWGLAACFILVLGLGYYAYTTRTTLQSQIAALDQRTSERLTTEIQAVKDANASLASTVDAINGQVASTDRELTETREAADSLRRAQARTSQATTTNAEAVKAAREDAQAQVAQVDTKVVNVSNEVKDVAAGLSAARNDFTTSTKELTAKATSLSQQIDRNATAVAELRRRGERDHLDFDIRKGSSPETWTVGDIRVELRKTDPRRSKYDVILHVDDRQFEKKDRTANEPVPFLVGRDQLRYELVVTAVDRDRIRGYVSVPRNPSLAGDRPVGQ